MIYKTLHRKLKIGRTNPTKNRGWTHVILPQPISRIYSNWKNHQCMRSKSYSIATKWTSKHWSVVIIKIGGALYGYSGFLHRIKYVFVTIPILRTTKPLCSSLITNMNALDGEWKCQVIHKNTKTINVRENRRDTQEWAIQKNWQH